MAGTVIFAQAFFAAALLAVCATVTDASAATALDTLRVSVAESPSTYRLATGDKVHVIVYGEDDLSGDFEIDGNGFVRMPLIGQVKAQGLSTHDLESSIAQALADGYLNAPRVSVEITNYRPFYIIGEVNKPGQYPYVNDMTALNAVALAGGYTAKAEDDVVYVRRNGEAEEHKMRADQATRILPGDVVRVPTSVFWSLVDMAGPISAIVSTRWYLPVP